MFTLRAAAEVRDQMEALLSFMLAMLTHDLGKAVSTKKNDKGAWQSIGHEHTGVPLAESMLTRLNASKKAIAYAKNMCALHMRLHTCYYGRARVSRTNVLFDESVSPRELAWLVVCDSRGTGKPRSEADKEQAFIMERLAAYCEAASQTMPDAGMMMGLGVLPGPKMKLALAQARKRVLCGEDAEQAARRVAEEFKN